MELWIGKAKKASMCQYCMETIPKTISMAQTRTKKRKGHPWPPVLRWHLVCWYESCQEFLARVPDERVEDSKLGRPRVVDTATSQPLCQEAHRARFLIIRRFNTLRWRRGKQLDKLVQNADIDVDHPVDADILQRAYSLTERMNDCMEEIKQYGGVPPSWDQIMAHVKKVENEYGGDDGQEDSRDEVG